jgi:hypothetical protein
MLLPTRGIVLGFMQFSTVSHGMVPYDSTKDLRPEFRSFIHEVLGLPLAKASEPENICLYLGALSWDDFDHQVWRFVPSGYATQSYGVNCF